MASDEHEVTGNQTDSDQEDVVLPSVLDGKLVEVSDLFMVCWAGRGFTRPADTVQ
jgi:hypothetical protein